MDILNIGLPKWPGMVVRGTPVTVEQAKDIIRRTDSAFLRGIRGNNHAFNKEIVRRLRMPPVLAWDVERLQSGSLMDEFERRDDWQTKWECLPLTYVSNAWIACSYIGGPHGWCHPNGTIAYDSNVGKWPSVEAVLNDWALLASAFPFLDLTATLMDRELCEEGIRPLVTITVQGGKATAGEPVVPPNIQRQDVGELAVAVLFRSVSREFGIPMEWLDEWEVRAKALFDEADA